MASIRKRGRNWEVRIRRKGKSVSRSFDTKAEAEAFAGHTESKILRGRYISQKEAERTTVREGLERFIHEYINKRLAHPKKEEGRARLLQKQSFARKSMAELRGVDLAAFIASREEGGAGPNTIRLDLAIISRLFNVARTDWGMEGLHNPVHNVSRPKLPPGRMRRLEGDEEERLLKAADEDFRPVLLFALETAMRSSEIAGLNWKRVDLKGRTALLPETKNDTARSVPLSHRALQVLQELPRNISGKVFNYTPDDITSEMGSTCARAGIKGLRFHDLRHEAISRFFEETDLDVMEIAGITGHKTLQMLKRYTHLRAGHLADRLSGKRRGR